MGDAGGCGLGVWEVFWGCGVAAGCGGVGGDAGGFGGGGTHSEFLGGELTGLCLLVMLRAYVEETLIWGRLRTSGVGSCLHTAAYCCIQR